MDKSFNWLKKSSRKSNKTAQKFGTTTTSNYYNNNNTQETCYTTNMTQEEDDVEYTQADEEEYDMLEENICFAPSMSSSFDMSKPNNMTAKSLSDQKNQQSIKNPAFIKCHSTPRSLFSPIRSLNASTASSSFSQSYSYSCSYSSSMSISPSLHSQKRRLSFGITSSPMSASNSILNLKNSTLFSFVQNPIEKITLNNDKMTLKDNVERDEFFVDYKLLDHIEAIRNNIKKRSYEEEEADLETAEDKLSSSLNKKRKLQEIFHLKLKKQLKEIKKSKKAKILHSSSRINLNNCNQMNKNKQNFNFYTNNNYEIFYQQQQQQQQQKLHHDNFCDCYDCYLTFKREQQLRKQSHQQQQQQNMMMNYYYLNPNHIMVHGRPIYSHYQPIQTATAAPVHYHQPATVAPHCHHHYMACKCCHY